MLGYNHILERYISDNGLVPPDKVYCSIKYRDSCFKELIWLPIRITTVTAGIWNPGIRKLPILFTRPMRTTYPYFKEYLDGNRPFLKEHYFQIHYWKQLLKRLIHYHS